MANANLEELVRQYDEWMGYLKNFKEVEYLPQFRQKLGESAYGDPSHFVGQSSDILYAYLQPKAIATEKKLVDYAKKNLDSILAKIAPEKLLDIALQTMPYKTGNEKHDKIAEQHQKFLEIAVLEKAPIEAKKEYLGRYIKEILKDEDFVPGVAYALLSPQYVQSMYELIVNVRKNKLIRYFVEGRKIDKAKIEGYLKTNISATKEEERKGLYVYLAKEAVGEKKSK